MMRVTPPMSLTYIRGNDMETEYLKDLPDEWNEAVTHLLAILLVAAQI